MNRLFLALLALAFIIGCSKPPSSKTRSDVFLIGYARESGGVLYQGTVNLIGNKVEATWYTAQGGRTESRSMNMSEATFRSLWDTVEVIEDFKKGAVTDPNERLDPKTHHVISLAIRSPTKEGMHAYRIPPEGTSAAFKEWLGKLGYPGK